MVGEFGKTRKGGDVEGAGGKSGKSKSYGFLCVSLLFRPLPATAVAPEFAFRATIGNEEDDAAMGSTQKASSSKASRLMAETGAARGGRSPTAGAGSGGWRMSSSAGKYKAGAAPPRTPTGVVEDETEAEGEEGSVKKKSSFGFSQFFRRQRKSSAAPSLKKTTRGKTVTRATTLNVLFGEEEPEEEAAMGEEATEEGWVEEAMAEEVLE